MSIYFENEGMIKLYKRLKEIDVRKGEIRGILEGTEEFDVAVISDELEKLAVEERGLMAKAELLQKAQSGQTKLVPAAEGRAAGGLTTAEAQMYETRKTKEYRNAFYNMLRYGKESLSTEERSSLEHGNAIGNGRNIQELRFTSGGSSAGAAIPTITLDQVVQKMLIVSAVYPFISKTNIKGNLKIPYESVFNDAAWTSESTPAANPTDALNNVTLQAYDLIKTVQVSRVVEQLSIDAFEAYIVDKLFKKLMTAIENACLNGTGSNQPTGILQAITWTVANQITYGKSGQGLLGITYDTFTQTKAKLLAPYHPGAYWVMNSNTLYSGVCGIKDALGRPIFLENPQWGLSTANGQQTDFANTSVVGRLLGNPVIMSPYIADGVILFGNLSFYHFNLSVDVLIEKSYEIGFLNNDVWYKGWLLGDGNVSQEEAFVSAIPHA